MEFRHLRSFIVLAQERHFGRAAARLHIAQPALSQQLQQLEREVGTLLVDRSTRRVDLTDAGRLLEERATDVLARIERTAADIALVGAGRSGTVRVGFVGTATYDVLPQLARRVRAEMPDVHLELAGELLAPTLFDAVHDGSLDLAVLRPGAGTVPAGLVVDPLRTEPLVAVLPSTHPHAGAAEVSLTDLGDEVLITHPAGARSMMQPLVLDAWRAAGHDPERLELLEVGETGTLVVFVAAGLGIGLVPASVRALRLDGVAYVPLSGPVPEVPLALAHRVDPGPAVLRVADVVRAVAR